MKSHTWYHNFPERYRAKSVKNNHKLPKCTERSNIPDQSSNVQGLGSLAQEREKSNIWTFMRYIRTLDASVLWLRRAWTRTFNGNVQTFDIQFIGRVHAVTEIGVFTHFLPFSSLYHKWVPIKPKSPKECPQIKCSSNMNISTSKETAPKGLFSKKVSKKRIKPYTVFVNGKNPTKSVTKFNIQYL